MQQIQSYLQVLALKDRLSVLLLYARYSVRFVDILRKLWYDKSVKSRKGISPMRAVIIVTFRVENSMQINTDFSPYGLIILLSLLGGAYHTCTAADTMCVLCVAACCQKKRNEKGCRL